MSDPVRPICTRCNEPRCCAQYDPWHLPHWSALSPVQVAEELRCRDRVQAKLTERVAKLESLFIGGYIATKEETT